MSAYGDGSSITLGAIEPNELVRRALGGCADSFTELAQRFRPRLLNLLRSRKGLLRSDAEDIVQEALSRAHQQLERFDQRYRFSTWLYTIAIRLACDHARNQQRRPRHVRLEEAHTMHWKSDVAERTERREEVDNLWLTARSVLTDSQYTAMWLRYGEDMSTAEVAHVMQKTRIGVRVLLHRSRCILIAELRGEGRDAALDR
jgi:RNA polymerase sigma-70 factor (ECF subfamily)